MPYRDEVFCNLFVDLELNSLLLNASDLVNELAMNLSIPADVTDSVLSCKLNMSEVFHFKLFLMYRGISK